MVKTVSVGELQTMTAGTAAPASSLQQVERLSIVVNPSASLPEVVESVRAAARQASLDPTDEEIVHAAEDILRAQQRVDDPSRPHEYNVGPDGTVHGWRQYVPVRVGRPTTDGQSDEEPVHWHELEPVSGQVVDEDETTQSDDPDMLPVPTDRSFGAHDTKRAPDLARIAAELIETIEDFSWLGAYKQRLMFYWDRKLGSSNGKLVLYRVRLPNKQERREIGAVMILTFSAAACREMRIKRPQIEALIGESIYSIGRNESGQIRKVGPDAKIYLGAYRRWGPYLAELAEVTEAAQIGPEDQRNARLIGMFDDDESDE